MARRKNNKARATLATSRNGTLTRLSNPCAYDTGGLPVANAAMYYVNNASNAYGPVGVACQLTSGQWRAWFSGLGCPKAYQFASGLQALRWLHRVSGAIQAGAMAYPHVSLGTWVSGYNGP